jgi:hypothetical protein
MKLNFHPVFRSMFLICLMFGFFAGTFQALAFAGEADSLRWHFEGQRRMRDGGVEAHFSLYGADDLKIDELEFYYAAGSSMRLKSQGDQPESSAAVYYKKVPADTRYAVIYSGRYARVELWAVAKTGNMTHVTQTALNLYGESGIDKTDFEKLDAFPPLPGLDIQRGGRYTVMTGEPISFKMRIGDAKPVRVYLDGERIAELLPDDDVYSYILPSGRKLATHALMDYHELLFVTDAFDAEDNENAVRFSCCLPLYRSMRDNQDLPGGIATLFSAVVLSIIAVILKGRRFAWRQS